jgi:hypothetical protein
MLNKQELFKLADKGAFRSENIKKLIKEDFQENYHSSTSLMNLYDKLANKYGKSRSTIMAICNE